jgi:uncharacterized membrane protein (UPF0127 family)
MSKRRSPLLSWLLVGLVLILVGIAGLYILWPQLQPHTTLRIGDGVFKTRVAKTSDEREKGLSGTAELHEDQALLFIFGTDGKWAMWMKDMNYPIDIVWLDKDKAVVHIVKNAPPESYPYEKFVSKDDARYVVELPAGTTDKKSIKIGGKAAFDENHLEGFSS